jgi:hypothetical protein
MPLTLKPVPEAAAPVILRFDPPELVKVCVVVCELPTTTEPKAIDVGLAVTDPSAMAFPLSGIVRLGLEPSDVIVTDPFALPVEEGANFTLKLTLWPEFKVVGRVNPLMLNPAPAAVAAEIFRLEPPEFVSVSEIVWLFPTTSVPKLTLEGLAVSAPSATALPLSGIISVGLEPSDEIVSEPLGLPTALGLNFTLIEALCPGFRVTGRAKPLTEKPAPVVAADEIVTLEPPVLVSVSATV